MCFITTNESECPENIVDACAKCIDDLLFVYFATE